MELLKNETPRNRITSIDALRAVVLFGILLVHTCNYFGYQVLEPDTFVDSAINRLITGFLSNRCSTIFSLLFGVSFYLILRNPNNTSLKFAWRCFLLMLIGILNKLFYTYDALMWYGICGMLLVTMRHLSPRNLLLSFLSFRIIDYFLAGFNLGDMCFGEKVLERYTLDASLFQIISYKYAIVDYLRIALNGGVLETLSWFILGYWFGKTGIIENLENRVKLKFVILFWLVFVINSIYILIAGNSDVLFDINIFFATFAYSSLIIYAYYSYKPIRNILVKLEPYGKLGLTNYSMQGIMGVLLFTIFKLYEFRMSIVISVFVVFYFCQAVFSYIWLSFFRYGPMEYAWRVITERKRIPLRKMKK